MGNTGRGKPEEAWVTPGGESWRKAGQRSVEAGEGRMGNARVEAGEGRMGNARGRKKRDR